MLITHIEYKYKSKNQRWYETMESLLSHVNIIKLYLLIYTVSFGVLYMYVFIRCTVFRKFGILNSQFVVGGAIF